MVSESISPFVAAARAVAPSARACATQTERERRLPASLASEFTEAGLFRMLVPAAYGGGEADVAGALQAMEEVARADGAAGWCLMIGATSGVVAAYLPEQAARPIYSNPTLVSGGVLSPTARAVPVDGGYRVSGRWAFGSGIEHCAWRIGACLVIENGTPRLLASGAPEVRVVLLPAAETEVIDTWDVSGLRGTGSQDFAVQDVFVPEERSYSLTTARPYQSGPLYRFPLFGLLALGIAAVALGIGRAAIDALTELAVAKVPTGGRRPLRERTLVQLQVAQAEGALRSGRALLYDTVAEAWRTAQAGEPVTLEQRALLRLAATTATLQSVQAVDLMYNAGGGSSIYATSPLQRHFRDVHALTQHVMVSPSTLETAGRLFLGLESDTALF